MTRFVERVFVWAGGALFVASLAIAAWWYAVGPGHLYRETMTGSPEAAVVADVVLFSVFALHHSVFARAGVKAWLSRTVPDRLLRSIYVWAASLLLIGVCVMWQPIGGVIYRAPVPLAVALALVQLSGVGLIWSAVRAIDPLELAGIRPAREGAALQTSGPYKVVRHPLYLGWILVVCGSPTMTGDRLFFALISSAYLVIAIPREERALEAAFGPAYAAYRARVRRRLVPGVY